MTDALDWLEQIVRDSAVEPSPIVQLATYRDENALDALRSTGFSRKITDEGWLFKITDDLDNGGNK